MIKVIRNTPFKGIDKIARLLNLSTGEAAFLALDRSIEIIYRAVSSLLEEINSRPVYTIYELLKGKKISPEFLVLIGGPAKAMSLRLAAKFGCPVLLPPNWEVANATGAALARSTCELTLVADTERGWLNIIEENIQRRISKDVSPYRSKKKWPWKNMWF